ncbi:MAG: hypothetical protein WCF26_23455 [Candidatus Sulfotelmatobacter sp.]
MMIRVRLREFFYISLLLCGLQGYIAWRRRDFRQVSAMLSAARDARRRDWKPAGSALEGDVQRRMYSKSGFLNMFEQQWDDPPELTRAYGQLEA